MKVPLKGPLSLLGWRPSLFDTRKKENEEKEKGKKEGKVKVHKGVGFGTTDLYADSSVSSDGFKP